MTPFVQKSRAAAREIMRKLGYGPDKRLALKVSTRNIPPYRDPAVILTDQLKEVYIDGELGSLRPPAGSPRSRVRITRSASTSPAAVSTIPTSNFTKTMPAARHATTPDTATPSSKSCSTGNQP